MTRICGKEYSMKGTADIPCLSLSCCPLCGSSLKRRKGVHVSQKMEIGQGVVSCIQILPFDFLSSLSQVSI